MPRATSVLSFHLTGLVLFVLCTEGSARGQEPEKPAPATPAPAPAQQGTGGAPPSPDAFKYGSPPALAEGLTEEVMWPAATAEGWRSPVLVEWQRNFDDALKAARERHAPLLVSVNMDGEIASEHFAGVRYRDPVTAAEMNRYVCIAASVYRHTPRDYDEQGQRVPCPRLGTMTCGEHINAERELYDKYFDGKRISPRHIMLDLEGNEQYDVYYSWDTATVFTAFREGVKDWPEPRRSEDMPLEQLTQSADVTNRQRVEQLYREGDRATRRRLLESVLVAPAVDQVELLRMAAFGLDLELAQLARRALTQCHTEGAIDLMAEVLAAPIDATERAQLLAAAAELGVTSHRARTLVTLHAGLGVESDRIDRSALTELREEDARRSYSSAQRTGAVLQKLESAAEAAEARPDDVEALVALAESYLLRAEAPGLDPRMAKLLVTDAYKAALGAERKGASGPFLDALVAVAAAELGDEGTARTRAFTAIEGGVLGRGAAGEANTPEAAADEAVNTRTLLGARLGERARVRLLLSFAEARQAAIRARYRARAEWPGEWMSDVHSAYASIIGHPLVDAGVLTEYYDFLSWIGATERARGVLEDALARFSDDPVLHDRLRSRLLWDAGARGLEAGYAARLEREAAAVARDGATRTQLEWFAGYASLVAAEHERRRNEFESAAASYRRARGQFERNIEHFPDGRDNADHFIALAFAGEARLALEEGALDRATTAIEASVARRAASAATQDGLGLTPLATMKMLFARLQEAGDVARAMTVRSLMDSLDPALLEPPPTELPPNER